MDKAGTRYGKENRPEKKRQILHNIIYMWKLKKRKKERSGTHGRRGAVVVARGLGAEEAGGG